MSQYKLIASTNKKPSSPNISLNVPNPAKLKLDASNMNVIVKIVLISGEKMNDPINNGLYEEVKSVLELARSRAYAAVNFAVVEAYWHVGRLIVERQSGEERAAKAV